MRKAPILLFLGVIGTALVILSRAQSVIAPNMTPIATTVMIATPNTLPAIAPSSPTTAAYSWTAPTLNTDGSALSGTLTYNVYEGPAGGLVEVATGLLTLSFGMAGGFTPGIVYCFAVSAIENGVESAQSAQACVKIPLPVPASPSVTVTA